MSDQDSSFSDSVQSGEQATLLVTDHLGSADAAGNCGTYHLLHLPRLSILHGTPKTQGVFVGNVNRSVRWATETAHPSQTNGYD